MRPACKAVIFDFDGVLVDSLPFHVTAWDRASESLFGAALPADMRQTIVGRQTRKISEMINERHGKNDVDGLMKEKARQVIALAKDVKLMPGAHEFIRYVESLNIPYGIASNAPRDFVHGVCEANGLKLTVKLGVEDAGKPKPAPDLFIKCATLLGIPKDDFVRCIVFEDSLHGIDAAITAGMQSIGVTTHHTDQELRAKGARETCRSLDAYIKHPLICGEA